MEDREDEGQCSSRCWLATEYVGPCQSTSGGPCFSIGWYRSLKARLIQDQCLHGRTREFNIYTSKCLPKCSLKKIGFHTRNNLGSMTNWPNLQPIKIVSRPFWVNWSIKYPWRSSSAVIPDLLCPTFSSNQLCRRQEGEKHTPLGSHAHDFVQMFSGPDPWPGIIVLVF